MKELDKLKDLAAFLEEQIKKLEGEKPKKVNSYDHAVTILNIQDEDETVFDDIEVESSKFIKRLTIAKALGSRPFIVETKSWHIELADNSWEVDYGYNIEREGINYFHTKEQAENYLAVCLKENLL